ncbi:TrbC/VirB2 family protein [Neisseria dentiae]|uniref:TrbC/VirB2 family protein n=1 Tax=Neisseria dentiae TaxID=194197 RepID=UPI0035A1BBF8
MKKNFLTSGKQYYQNTLFSAMMLASGYTFATTTGGAGTSNNLGEACDKVSGFFGNIQSILQVSSIAVVTVAVILAGYQIAFAHKRVADVAPILIGALVIGAAGQVASWLVGDYSSANC